MRPTQRDLADYSARWDDYARRQALAVVAAIGGGIGAVLVSIYAAPHFHEATIIALGVWCAGSLAAASRINRFRCPRCGGLFCSRPGYSNQLTTHCLHCRLPLWDRSDSEGRGVGPALGDSNPLTESISRSWRRTTSPHLPSGRPMTLDPGSAQAPRPEALSDDTFDVEDEEEDEEYDIPDNSVTGRISEI